MIRLPPSKMSASSSSEPPVRDYLHLAADSHLKKVFGAIEQVLFSDTVVKINRKDKSQERTFVVTTGAVYNLKHRAVQRRIAIEVIEAFSVATGSEEIVLSCPSEYDYRLTTSKRDEIIAAVNYARKKHGLAEATVDKVGGADLKEATNLKGKRLTLTGAPLMGAGMTAQELAAEAEARAAKLHASDELVAPLGAIAEGEGEEDSDSD